MSWLTELGRLFVPAPETHERSASEFPDLSEQLAAIRRAQAGARPWRSASVDEALGVPAILSAVALISNTVGTLTLEAFRNGDLVTELSEIPQLIKRPNPLTTPRAFFRDTAFYLATRGEAWWWIAKRDPRDGTPLSLFPVKPWEIMLEPNSRNVLEPTIKWNDRVIPRDDMRQITYLPGNDGRGRGPLQIAGAAVSVSVEADAFAANFYSGSIPSMYGTSDQFLTEADILAFDRQWAEKPNNLPRWFGQGMKLGETPFDAQKAQLLEARMHEVGQAARMFSMPGDLIEFQMGGTALRYRNDETIWTDFQRRCLSPHYLEPIEQEMSDLLTPSLHAEFDLEGLLRADAKTRAEVYEKLVPIGVLLPEEARRKERLAPGNPDLRPVPLSPPQAVVERLPYQRSAAEPLRCSNPKCGWLLAESAGPGTRITCRKCHTVTTSTSHQREALPAPVQPQLTISPQISLAAPDLSVMERIADETKRGNELQVRNQEILEELVRREQPIPQVNVEAAPAPEVNVLPDPRFVEAVADLKALMATPRKRNLIRNEEGRIVGVEDVA